MIYLDSKSFDVVCRHHHSKLKSKIVGKINSNKPQLPPYIKRYLIDNIDKILTDRPNDLLKVNTAFYDLMRSKKNRYLEIVNGKLVKIFDYQSFTNKNKKQYDAYDLAEKLNIQTCTYCNRSRTITVLTGKEKSQHITRPQFDHYFAKSIYPLLALSFYNLIPSCSTCNSTLKGDKEFDLSQHIHPYLDNCYNHFRFSFSPGSTASMRGAKNNHRLKILFDSKKDPVLAKKIEETFNIFKIREIYSAHGEEISDLLRVKEVMSDNYLKILAKSTYPHLKVTQDELYRLAFGTHRDEAEFSKRPFSKLKKDILKEIGII